MPRHSLLFLRFSKKAATHADFTEVAFKARKLQESLLTADCSLHRMSMLKPRNRTRVNLESIASETWYRVGRHYCSLWLPWASSCLSLDEVQDDLEGLTMSDALAGTGESDAITGQISTEIE